MNRSLFIATLLGTLLAAGCTISPYGNHIKDSANQQPMGRDAAQKLAAMWQPASTRIELQQKTPDTFGVSLVAELRDHGFAVAEYNPQPAHNAGNKEVVETRPEIKVLQLRYVVDNAGSGLYRLSLGVDSATLSRAYEDRGGSIKPAGYWSRREQ